MSFQIGAKYFDKVEGEIMLPQQSTQRYTTPASSMPGVQVLPGIGPPFTLTLWRYNADTAILGELNYGRFTVGNIVALIAMGIDYESIGFRFVCLDYQLQRTEFPLYAAGSRGASFVEHSPASLVVAAYTFQAFVF